MLISEFYLKHQFNTDKYGLGYLTNFYDSFLTTYLNRDITLLEIGVYYGGSIEMWRQYFSPNSVIYAGDIISYRPIDRVNCIVGDMYSDSIVNSFSDNLFDLIIDDGPHTFNSFTAVISKYFQKIKAGGHLIIEDVIKNEWVEPLITFAKYTGFSEVRSHNMAGYQKDEKLLNDWKHGLHILELKK